MGDRTYTPIGKYARDIYSGDQQLVDNYATEHKSIVKQLTSVTGINRSLALSFFNESYAYDRDIRIPQGASMMYTIPKNVPVVYPEYAYLKRILDFCLKTDVCQKLGLSVEDFMNLDLATLEFIETSYYNHKPIEQEAIDGIMREADIGKLAKKGR